MKKMRFVIVCLAIVGLGVYSIVTDDIHNAKKMKEQRQNSIDRAVRDYAKQTKDKIGRESIYTSIDTNKVDYPHINKNDSIG